MTSTQPVEHLPLPLVVMDKDTGQQSSPHTPPASVDRALLDMVQTIQHELRTPMHGMLALIDSLRADLRVRDEGEGEGEGKGEGKGGLGSGQSSTGRQTLLRQKVNDMRSLGVQLQEILDDFRDYVSGTGVKLARSQLTRFCSRPPRPSRPEMQRKPFVLFQTSRQTSVSCSIRLPRVYGRSKLHRSVLPRAKMPGYRRRRSCFWSLTHRLGARSRSSRWKPSGR